MLDGLQEIDDALAEYDLKRAELAIAKSIKAELSPAQRAALLQRRAQLRLSDARPDDGLEDLTTAVALDPALQSLPQTYILWGDLYLARFELAKLGFANREHIQEALASYRQVVEQFANHTSSLARVYYQLGRIYLILGQVEAAQAHFDQALQYPAQPSALHSMAYERLGFIALFEQRQPQRAIYYFKQALGSITPDSERWQWIIQLHLRLSRAYAEQTEGLLAAQHIRQALQMAIAYSNVNLAILPEAYLSSADILSLLTGFEDESIEYYLKFLQSSEKPPGIDVTWSRVYEQIGLLSLRLAQTSTPSQGQFRKWTQQAIHAFEKALQSNPYHPWEGALCYYMAQSHYQLQQFDRAIGLLEELEKSAPSLAGLLEAWRIALLKGHAYFAQAYYLQARAAYRHALDLAPTTLHNKAAIQGYLHFAEQHIQIVSD
jgi:tetratricopeptide (TPR) repeat protein